MFKQGAGRAIVLALVLMTLTSFFLNKAVDTIGRDTIRDAARVVVDLARQNAGSTAPAGTDRKTSQ